MPTQDLTKSLESKIDRTKWIKWKFKDIVENVVEKVIPKECGLEHYIGLKHLDTGSLKIRRFGESASISGDKLKIYKGDLIFAKRNSYLKRVAIAEFDAVASAHSLVLRPKKENVLPEFLPFFLMSEKFWERAIEISVGSLSPTINWKVLAKQEFLLPPKDQQSQMAELLWAMHDFVSSIICVEDILWILKRKISQEHYYDKTIPHERLRNLCDKIQDGSHFSPQEIYNNPSKNRFRYVTSKNIRKTGLEFKEDQYVDEIFHRKIYNRWDPQKGDVLITKDGAKTGVATINSLEEEFSLLSSVCLLRPNTNKMTSGYLCQYLNSDIGFNNMIGKMTGTAIKRLTLKTINAAKVPAASLEIQDKITKKLNAIDSSIYQNRRNQEKSKHVLKSLINQIF